MHLLTLEGVATVPRSVRHRRARRRLSPYVWGVVPVLDPYTERLREAALGGHRCQIWRINAMPRRDDQAAETDTPQIVDSPASALEPTAVRAAEQANADKDLPDADTDTKEAEKAAKGRS